jgi:hypothetical protein
VVAQHGEEFVDVNREIDRVDARVTELYTKMLEGTADRYTATDALRQRRLDEEHEEIQDRRLEQLERELKR